MPRPDRVLQVPASVQSDYLLHRGPLTWTVGDHVVELSGDMLRRYSVGCVSGWQGVVVENDRLLAGRQYDL